MYVLSLRKVVLGPAQGCVVELEDVFAQLTQATILCPSDEKELETMLAALPAESGDLFIAALILSWPVNLLKGIRRWRRPFRRVYCYVFDCWVSEAALAQPRIRHKLSRFHRVVRQMDHVFVSNRRGVDDVGELYRVPVSYVPMAADVKQFGSMQASRPISVNAYGRQHQRHVDALASAYNTNRSTRALYHTSHVSSAHVVNLQQHRAFFWKMLTMSCITLAYDPVLVDPGQRQFPYSFLGQRWFEGLAAGCVIVGYRPRCAETDELLTWEDATIECPDDTGEFLAFVEALLADEARLARVRRSNFSHMARSHDWGHRVVDMLGTLQIDVLPAWSSRLNELVALADAASLG